MVNHSLSPPCPALSGDCSTKVCPPSVERHTSSQKKRRVLIGLEAEIKEVACLIRLSHWVAAKNVILQNTGERPSYAGIGGITPARLTEIGVYAVELPPGDYHLVAIRRVDRNRRLVRGVAGEVVATCIDVCLEAGEHAELRDHARRGLYFPRRPRRHILGCFKWLVQRQPAHRRQRLSRSGGKRKQRDQRNQWGE